MKLLFERLQAHDGPADAFDIKRAIVVNAQRLASNRVIEPPDLADDVQPSAFDVLTCGLPSIVELASADQGALQRFAMHLRALIAYYEPRLREPRVEIEPHAGLTPFCLVVSGMLLADGGMEALRFPVATQKENDTVAAPGTGKS